MIANVRKECSWNDLGNCWFAFFVLSSDISFPRLVGLDRSFAQFQPSAWWTSRTVLLFLGVGNGPLRAVDLFKTMERQELLSGRTAGASDGYSLSLSYLLACSSAIS